MMIEAFEYTKLGAQACREGLRLFYLGELVIAPDEYRFLPRKRDLFIAKFEEADARSEEQNSLDSLSSSRPKAHP